MITYVQGNILESDAQALVNTVNTVGVMGKGIALLFNKRFPENYKAYLQACKRGEIDIGKLFVFKEHTPSGEKIIINFPTKKDWRKPSSYEYIEKGLDDLLRVIEKYGIQSIAIPPLGCGNGRLVWEKVRTIIEHKLNSLNIDVFVYEPTQEIVEVPAQKEAELTPARALLLYVLYDQARQGEYVSEFSAEKICYFLQRFGAEKYFRLTFQPNFYGPYSGKVRHVLHYLNGSYIMGYSDLTRRPFDPLILMANRYEMVKQFVEADSELRIIADYTTRFLDGFYSDFALELLSTVDWIMNEKKTDDIKIIKEELNRWSRRKRSKFSSDRHLRIAIEHIKAFTQRK